MQKLLTFVICLVAFSTIGCGGVESSATAKKSSLNSVEGSPQPVTNFVFSWMNTEPPDGYHFTLNVKDKSLSHIVDELSTHEGSRFSRPIRLVCKSAESESTQTFELEFSGTWLELLDSVSEKYGCTIQETEAEILIQDGVR